MRLKDKVAIITGSSSGIGRAIALAYVREGAKVVISATHEDRCEKVVDEIKEAGGQAISVVCDVSNLDDQKNLLKESLDAFGKVDILVNNAAYSAREDIFEVTPESGSIS